MARAGASHVKDAKWSRKARLGTVVLQSTAPCKNAFITTVAKVVGAVSLKTLEMSKPFPTTLKLDLHELCVLSNFDQVSSFASRKSETAGTLQPVKESGVTEEVRAADRKFV